MTNIEKIAELLNGTAFALKCDFTGKGINQGFYIEHLDKYMVDDIDLLLSKLSHDIPDDITDKEDKINYLFDNSYYYYSEWYDYADDEHGYIELSNNRLITVPEAIDLLSDDDKLKIWG